MSSKAPVGSLQAAAVGRLQTALCLLVPAAWVLALAWPWLSAGWISDDGAILGWVARHAPLADLFGPQFGLDGIRFWRPLTTLSWDLQEAISGLDPGPARLANALFHGAGASVAAALLLRMGSGPFCALLAGLWVASFPHMGGTTGWAAGRVDALCLPFVLAAGWAVAAGRAGIGALAAALAVATKEMGWIALPFALAIAWLRPMGAAPNRVAVLAPAVVVVALIALRQPLLGQVTGGYGGALPSPWALLQGGAPALFLGLVPGVALLAAPVLCRFAGGEARLAARGVLAALGSVAFGAALLAHLLPTGEIPPEHLRTLLLPDALLGVLVLLGWVRGRERGAKGPWLLVAGALALGLVLARTALAHGDLARWGRAGEQAEFEVQRARAEANAFAPSPYPLFDGRVSRLDPSGRAYVLHWGFAERLRAPFPGTPRPVWPLRPIFPGPGPTHPRAGAGALWDPLKPVPEGAAAPLPEILVLRPSELLEPKGEPRLRWPLPLAPAQGGLWVLHTDQGYGTYQASPADWGPLSEEGGLGLRAVLTGGSGALFHALVHAVDFGADRALLELWGSAQEDSAPWRAGPWLLRFDAEFRVWLLGD